MKRNETLWNSLKKIKKISSKLGDFFYLSIYEYNWINWKFIVNILWCTRTHQNPQKSTMWCWVGFRTHVVFRGSILSLLWVRPQWGTFTHKLYFQPTNCWCDAVFQSKNQHCKSIKEFTKLTLYTAFLIFIIDTFFETLT